MIDATRNRDISRLLGENNESSALNAQSISGLNGLLKKIISILSEPTETKVSDFKRTNLTVSPEISLAIPADLQRIRILFENKAEEPLLILPKKPEDTDTLLLDVNEAVSLQPKGKYVEDLIAPYNYYLGGVSGEVLVWEWLK